MSNNTQNAALHAKLEALSKRIDEHHQWHMASVERIENSLTGHRDQHDKINLGLIGSFITAFMAAFLALFRRHL